MVTFISTLENNLDGCYSLLDVGCGDNSPVRFLNKDYKTVGIDGHRPSIAFSKAKKIHDKYILGNIQRVLSKIKPKSFDAVIALDVIEHLTKNDGLMLLKHMERIAKKRIILVTPNGFIPQKNKNNDLQEHLSGWTVLDFKKAGYEVIGMYGLKVLAHPFKALDGSCKYRPALFWGLIWGILAELAHHLFTKNNPSYSFSLMAVKNK